jgi:hypothetical protein
MPAEIEQAYVGIAVMLAASVINLWYQGNFIRLRKKKIRWL